MATATETEATRTAGYPFISEAAWWQLRKLFRTKGFPKNFDANYLVNADIRQNVASANNLVRPFTRFGFFGDDGKVTQRAWDWIEDATYPDVCRTLLHEIYLEELTSLFTTPTDEDRTRLERWFQRNKDLAPNSARQYAAFYMLLLKADPAEQDAANGAQSGKSPKAAPRQLVPSRPRAPKANAQAVGNILPMVPVPESQRVQESVHSQTPLAHHARGAVEPTLNINVQIHIPAEASAEQIEQIFKSMAKYLYQQQNEAGA